MHHQTRVHPTNPLGCFHQCYGHHHQTNKLICLIVSLCSNERAKVTLEQLTRDTPHPHSSSNPHREPLTPPMHALMNSTILRERGTIRRRTRTWTRTIKIVSSLGLVFELIRGCGVNQTTRTSKHQVFSTRISSRIIYRTPLRQS